MPGALTTESLTEQPSLISDTPSNLRRRCGRCGRDHARSDKNSCLPIRPSRIVVPDQIKRLDVKTPDATAWPQSLPVKKNRKPPAHLPSPCRPHVFLRKMTACTRPCTVCLENSYLFKTLPEASAVEKPRWSHGSKRKPQALRVRETPTCCKYPIPGCAPPYLMSLQSFVSLCTLQSTRRHSKDDFDHCSGCRWSLTRDLSTWWYAADAITSCAWSKSQRRLDRNHVDIRTRLTPVLTLHMEVPWDSELALDKWPLLLRGGLSLSDPLNSCSLLASFSHASLSSSLFVPHTRPASLYYVAPLPLHLCSSTRRPHLSQGAQVWGNGRQVGSNQRDIVTSLIWT